MIGPEWLDSGGSFPNVNLTVLGIIFVGVLININAMIKYVYTALLCFSVQVISAQVCLYPSQNLSSTNNPRCITNGDFNNDGNIDLAVGKNGAIEIFLGNPTGAFQSSTLIPVNFGPTNQIRSIFSSDVNLDGKTDLMFLIDNHQFARVLLGDGVGNFSFFGSGYMACTSPLAVMTDDFNNDTIPDLIIANLCSPYFHRYLGTGTGSFVAQHVPFFNSGSCYDVSGADFNNDGNRDLVLPSSGQNAAAVALGLGTGSFSPISLFASGSSPRGVTVADYDQDGNEDIALSLWAADSIAVLMGNGAGGFANPVLYETGQNPSSIKSADVDQDGDVDILVANSGTSSNVVSIFLNNGGSFAAPLNFTVSGSPLGLSTGDFNKDGFPDFASVNLTGSGVSVWLSNHPKIIGSATVCSGNSITFQASGSGIASYTWTTGQNSQTISISPVNTGTLGVSVSNTLAGCVSQSTVSYNVLPLPNVLVNSSRPLLCVGETATLLATGAQTYFWPSLGSVYSSATISPISTSTYTVVGTDTNGCSKSTAYTQTVSICSGLEALSSKQELIKFSPNPSEGVFNLSGLGEEPLQVVVYDLLGQKVMSAAVGDSHALDMSNYPKGIYFCQVIKHEKILQQARLVLK